MGRRWVLGTGLFVTIAAAILTCRTALTPAAGQASALAGDDPATETRGHGTRLAVDLVSGATQAADGAALAEEVGAPGGGEAEVPVAPEANAAPPASEAAATSAAKETQPLAPTDRPASIEAADALFARGDVESWYQARRQYSDLMRRGLTPAEHLRVRARLMAINDVLFFSPAPCPGARFVVVASGESLGKICQREQQSLGVVVTTNQIANPDRVRAGARLKIVEGTLWLAVDKENLRLHVMLDEDIVAEFEIGVGSYGRTPTGTFTIETRIEKPDWYSPDGRVIRYGEADHAIGTRWLGFRPTAAFQGYGIHGTNEPQTVPGRESAGCIRMRNEEVERLYPLVAAGTKVVIS